MQCPSCGEECTHIEIRLKDDDAVQFFSCRQCEAKWWEKDGGEIKLDEVLDLTSNRK